nr:MAG TPA: hypothetical protein [Bacteriophage sp.]
MFQLNAISSAFRQDLFLALDLRIIFYLKSIFRSNILINSL